jgi:ribosomal protein S3
MLAVVVSIFAASRSRTSQCKQARTKQKTKSTLIHYGKVHALLTRGSPIKVRVFQERKEAAEWLGVPIDRLTADTASL